MSDKLKGLRYVVQTFLPSSNMYRSKEVESLGFVRGTELQLINLILSGTISPATRSSDNPEKTICKEVKCKKIHHNHNALKILLLLLALGL